MPTDGELYGAWTAGDRSAGGRLVDRHLEAIGRFFGNKVTGHADIEDLVGETFERCAKNLGKYRGEGSFRAYLYGIAHNVLRDYIRRKQRGREQLDFGVTSLRDLGPTPSAVLGERREQTLLLQALRHIPLDHQIVLELSYFEGMSRREMAEVLGIPPGTVASRVRKGKQLLWQRIEELAESPSLLHSTIHGLEDWARGLQAQFRDDDG